MKQIEARRLGHAPVHDGTSCISVVCSKSESIRV